MSKNKNKQIYWVLDSAGYSLQLCRWGPSELIPQPRSQITLWVEVQTVTQQVLLLLLDSPKERKG